MKPYEYAKPGSDSVQLQIVKAAGRSNGARVAISDDSETAYVDVPASEVPAAALALYEAAGLPLPMILDRPSHHYGIEHAGSDDRHANTSRSGSTVYVGWRGIEPGELTPDEALEFAAHIAVNAEAAKRDEPDPADVESLAKAMRDAISGYGVPLPLANADEVAAHAALRWMREREADQ